MFKFYSLNDVASRIDIKLNHIKYIIHKLKINIKNVNSRYFISHKDLLMIELYIEENGANIKQGHMALVNARAESSNKLSKSTTKSKKKAILANLNLEKRIDDLIYRLEYIKSLI